MKYVRGVICPLLNYFSKELRHLFSSFSVDMFSEISQRRDKKVDAENRCIRILPVGGELGKQRAGMMAGAPKVTGMLTAKSVS